MNIAINIEFVKNSAPMGTGTQVYALRMADFLLKNNNVSIYINVNNKEYIDFENLFTFYNLSDDFLKKIDIKYYGVKKPRKFCKHKQYYEYQEILSEINNNFDLFIQANNGILSGTKQLVGANNKTSKSIHIVHFPMMKISKPYKLINSSKKDIQIYEKLQEVYLDSYDLFLCNSTFTKEAFFQLWGKLEKVKCLYPPVPTDPINTQDIKNKQNIITTIGRISEDKRILELATTFAKLNNNYKDYCFIILGQVLKKDEDYYRKVKNILKGTNHKIFISPNTKIINKYLTKSKFYWHAKGYNAKYKYRLEHFGMSTVEAMAKACVPIVINGAGQIEIVSNSCGYKWETLKQLQNYTENLINNENLRISMAKKSVDASKRFNVDSFGKELNYIFRHSLNLS